MIDVPGTALVTGATSGIGREVARQLAVEGWQVLLHARTDGEGREALRGLAESGVDPERLEPVVADFARLSQVRSVAAAVAARPGGLRLLVNNAALVGPPRRTLTVDGNELSWQVDYLAPYLLTRSLVQVLRAADGARVVNVSSSLHRMGTLAWSDLNSSARYSPIAAYAQAKLALTMFGVALAGRTGAELTVANVHPGVVRTRLLPAYGRGGAPVVDGAEAVLHAATAPVSPTSGGYYEGLLAAAPSHLVGDRAAVERLWQLTERILGLRASARVA
ncbi:SDR family NAD(P)-dependent oxidoreductase [Micromonospora krabiensis]|uniref:NAD(P)-dependent dehydrogenase, short-chain alcohol dehydrogenase family n=1 Tax=Micromonospora krabiensis TaxID=307121 RepID=A0A1C3N307_9ACTN|nr:SDR family NAD(P)-dependent oxidoreductase [Micromonospora krabiensis]SBV26951.1 NAD(P)-dependent dehydrogenase, short-chain alcohol dehydrogenase family [Micromonospora krabiensis]